VDVFGAGSRQTIRSPGLLRKDKKMPLGETVVQEPPRVFVRSFNDPDDYVSTIAIDSARAAGTIRGSFRASMGYFKLNDVNISTGSTSSPVTVIGTVPDSHVFTFGATPGSPRRISGRDVPDNHLIHLRPKDTLFASSPTDEPRRFSGIAVPYEVMATRGPTMMGIDPRVPLNDNALFAAPAGALPDLVTRIDEAIRMAEISPSVAFEPTVLRALSGSLITALIRCLTAGRPLPDPAPLHRRRRIIRKLIELMDERPEDMLSMTDVCDALGVPERTLNLLCREFFGISAMRYVRGRRMDHVRRLLLTNDPARASVTAFATQLGFWDLGRFAQAYRDRYGELPSQTLHRIGR
jgi:AraC-like DNA-binding protein